MGVVEQSAGLLSGTIRENIAYGKVIITVYSGSCYLSDVVLMLMRSSYLRTAIVKDIYLVFTVSFLYVTVLSILQPISSQEGATDGEVEEAARAAAAHDFIKGFPEGYNTQV